MEDLDKIIQSLYEDSVLGKLSDLRIQKISTQYETEQAEIQRLTISLEREIENEAGQIADVGKIRIPLAKPELPIDTEKPT